MGIRTWLEEDKEELIELYTSGKMTDPIELGEYFGKSHRSVISKLVQLEIYIAPRELRKKQPSVKEMVRELEIILDIEIDSNTLSKKHTIRDILYSVKNKLNIED